MPGDADVRQLLIEVLNELKDSVKEHDKRLRSLEIKAARMFGALGFAGFLVSALIALARHLF